MTELSPAELGKYAAARKALDLVETGMKLGLGTGSTAKWFVDLLAERMKAEGLELLCVPTSSRTKAQAESLGIPITTLDDAKWLDLTVDGADEFDPNLNLIKGGGGALLQEKIVATASSRMAVITDPSKEVAHLGAFPLPVEVIRFGWKSTAWQIERLLADFGLADRPTQLRVSDDGPYLTDEGHYILDLELGEIADPAGLCRRLNEIAGVVENGIFSGVAAQVIIGHADGTVRVIDAEKGDLGTSTVPAYQG